MYGRLSPFVDSVPMHLIEWVQTALATGSGGYRDRRDRQEQPHDSPGFSTPDSDLDFEFGLNQDLPRFVKGERVYHDTFGSGTVGEVSGFGRDLKVAVHFETVGSKRLLVRYAGLRRDFD